MKRAVFAAMVVILASPLVPLYLAWRRVLATRFLAGRRDHVLLTVIMISYLVMIGSLAFRDVVGADYSLRRYVTIYANLILMVVIAVWTMLRRGSLGALMPLVSALVAMVWAYALIVSSAV